MENNILKLTDCFNRFNSEVTRIYNTNLKDGFMLSCFLLSLPELIEVKVNDSDKAIIENYRKEFNSISSTKGELRRAFSNAYLNSLSEVENYKVDVSLEIMQIFFKEISEIIYKNIPYTNINVLNPYCNIGTLSSLLALGGIIDQNKLYCISKDVKEKVISESLKNMLKLNYEVDTALPSFNYRADLIISDPFFENANELLMFFADYTDYLSQNGFMVISLPTDFVRTRVFSDLLEQYSLTLILLVKGPENLAQGNMKSSIVVLEHNKDYHEFAEADMDLYENVDANLEVLENVKDYLNKYFRGE